MPDYPPPPSTPEPMSVAAAASMIAAAGSLRAAVYDVIEKYGPLAEWQIEELLHLDGNTVRPRLWELQKAKEIEKVKNLRGRTPSGRACNLYAVHYRETLFDL